MNAIKRVAGLVVRVGGEEHSGWLPPGAAVPRPTPVRDIAVDLEIQFDGSGYLLLCEAADGSFCWDSWHESLVDAEKCAAETYGVGPPQWVAVEPRRA